MNEGELRSKMANLWGQVLTASTLEEAKRAAEDAFRLLAVGCPFEADTVKEVAA